MEVSKKRWDLAQTFERSYWEYWKTVRSEAKPLIENYWARYLILLKPYVKPEDKILDIGCASDGLINYLSEGDKYGFDSLMDFYLSNFYMPTDVKWIKGIGEELPFESEHFDIVISTNTLDHIQNPRKFLKETRRVLKKGGVLFLTVNCHGPFERFYRIMREKMGLGVPVHPHTFCFWHIKKMLRKISFNIVLSCLGYGDLGRYIEGVLKEKVEGQNNNESKKRGVRRLYFILWNLRKKMDITLAGTEYKDFVTLSIKM